MTTTRAASTRSGRVLAVLFAGAFVMGCAEMLVVGMIDLIAADLAVSVPAAGALVTANALGLALGGPLLTFLTTRFDRRHVLIGATAVFVAANLLPALVADYPLFIAARVVIGAVQGLFIAAAMVTATSIVPPERTGRAMAVIISGFAMSSALGLPLGTLLGQAVGWRGSFAAVVAAGAVVLVLAIVVLPSVPTPRDSGAMGQARHAFAPRVIAVLAVSFLTFAAMLSAITYLVPFLNQVTDVSGPIVSVFLLVYGAATAIGSFGGGRFADTNASRALVVGGDRRDGVAGRPARLRIESVARGPRRARHRPVRHGHGPVDPVPRRQPRRPRRAARVGPARLGGQRRHRVRRVRRRDRDRRRGRPVRRDHRHRHRRGVAIAAAWATSLLQAPVAASVTDTEPLATR